MRARGALQASPVAAMMSGLIQPVPACSRAPYEVPAAARLFGKPPPERSHIARSRTHGPVGLKTQDYTLELLITQEPHSALDLGSLA